MEYSALLVGVSYELFDYLKTTLMDGAVEVSYALTITEGVREFVRKPYQLIIVDLQDIQHRNRYELLTALRQARFVPIMALMDSGGPEEAARILDFGVDICMPANIDPLLIRKHAKALIRRYTSYNHYDQPESIDIAPFQCGDIYIDSMRRTVQVCNEPVEMRPREFSLLLYFMRNPRIVLTSEQICDRAWGNEGSYGQGISGPVALLRRAIEPDPEHPIYIETIWRVGYRFTAHKSETCDKCHNRDGVM